MSCSRRKYKFMNLRSIIIKTVHEPILMSGRRQLYFVGISFLVLFVR